MNRYQFRDFIFGRDKAMLAAIESLLLTNVIKKGQTPDPFLIFEDISVSKNESDFTVDQLYDFFRKQLVMKSKETLLLPSCWITGNSRRVYNVNTAKDIHAIWSFFQDKWKHRGRQSKHLFSIENFFNHHTCVFLDGWPMTIVQILPKNVETDKPLVELHGFLEMLYESESTLSIDSTGVYLIWGLGHQQFSKHSVDHCVSKGLEGFRYVAIPEITKTLITPKVSVEVKEDLEIEQSPPESLDFEQICSKLLREWAVYRSTHTSPRIILSPRLIKDPGNQFKRVTSKQPLIKFMEAFTISDCIVGTSGNGHRTHLEGGASVFGDYIDIHLGSPDSGHVPLWVVLQKLELGEYGVSSRKKELANIKPNAMTKFTRAELRLYKRYYQLITDLFHSWGHAWVGAVLSSADLQEDTFTLRIGTPATRPDIDAIVGCMINFNYLGVNSTEKSMVRVLAKLKDDEFGNAVRSLRFIVSDQGNVGKQDLFIQDTIPFQTFYQYNDMAKMVQALQPGGELYSYIFGKPIHRLG